MSAATLKGQYLPEKSWEKQVCYKLSNGTTITIENSHYGDMVSRIDDEQGYWHCSSGRHTLPERFKFLLEWEEVVVQSAQTKIIRPKFEKITPHPQP